MLNPSATSSQEAEVPLGLQREGCEGEEERRGDANCQVVSACPGRRSQRVLRAIRTEFEPS